MGAWGYGPFENDAALDCVADLADADPGAVKSGLLGAMREATGSEDYLENPEADAAVAAAVLVAARLGADPGSGSAEALLASHPFEADGELRLEALRVFDRVTDPRENEWHDLWTDAGALEKVLELLAPYRTVLAAH
ncbi:DUF4259 domain-containing protein [Glycomyces luteolus]|uniref:DUF4259 domain-containing protein n=1 Tax=Glycomyces luteolus TaxID=2670330 RepID=A0A9X3PFM3_9ACTN|nr:DUF4259 domain-containing protein [Glycomyces luteolus]MDA1362852.1 DUF4259 domain-containing protein [Glycomyces luteolus]